MLAKYYSLDECFEQDKIYDRLDELCSESKLDYEIVDEDLIRLKDKALSLKEKKELIKLFEENDVIEHEDIDDEELDEDEFEDDEELDEEEF